LPSSAFIISTTNLSVVKGIVLYLLPLPKTVTVLKYSLTAFTGRFIASFLRSPISDIRRNRSLYFGWRCFNIASICLKDKGLGARWCGWMVIGSWYVLAYTCCVHSRPEVHSNSLNLWANTQQRIGAIDTSADLLDSPLFCQVSNKISRVCLCLFLKLLLFQLTLLTTCPFSSFAAQIESVPRSYLPQLIQDNKP
jgi:hypothetical protein